MKTIILICVVSIISACSRVESPEETLEQFVKLRLAGENSRARLLGYLSGPLYQKISEMTDPEFERFVDASQIRGGQFSINLKKCDSEEECHLTYTIQYTVRESKDVSHRVEVKKIAALRRVEKNWKIDAVSNVKSYIDANGINLPVGKQ